VRNRRNRTRFLGACPDDTWAKRVKQLGKQIENYSEIPACQRQLIDAFKQEMESALFAEKGSLLRRVVRLQQELQEKVHQLVDEEYKAAEKYIEQARNRVEANDFVVGCRRLAQAERVLREGRFDSSSALRPHRLPLPKRLHPSKSSQPPLREICRLAREFQPGLRSDVAIFLPDEAIAAETAAPDHFIARHANLEATEWPSYFKQLRIWLSIQDHKQLRPSLTLMANNNFWSSRSAKTDFVFCQPWHGAPFYEDPDGRGRIMAIMRLSLNSRESNRPNLIEQYVVNALQELIQQARASVYAEDLRFANQGLVLVMLPGSFLQTRGPYRQWMAQIRVESSGLASDRVAFIDDLDILRILRLGADERFRGLMEMVAARFLSSSHQTYQDSSAVGRRMFFGREEEVRRLESDGTVVFSGRKMGKSSLLRHVFLQCRESTDRRAVLVGCAGIAPWQSWRVLDDFALKLLELFHREEIPDPPRWDRPQLPLAMNDAQRRALFGEMLSDVKAKFQNFLHVVIERLRGRGIHRLFLLLDEADSFARAEFIENSGNESRSRAAVSWFLRDRETEHDKFLRIVFAGYDELGRTETLPHSAFGNWGSRINLGPLSEPAARRLIVEPLAALGILAGEDLADRILDYTAGHASLIQAFCGKTIEGVRDRNREWPLEDVELEFNDVRTIAESPEYQETMARTLELNLGIARSYPLELTFYALVSPTGLGHGKRLSLERFTLAEAEDQVTAPELSVSSLGWDKLRASLDLLVQLGLLESIGEAASPCYRFKARHFVNYLRTQPNFQARLQQSIRTWSDRTEQADAIPRHVWTILDDELALLYEPTTRVFVVCGLESSGREYLAELLGQGRAVHADQENWTCQLQAQLERPEGRLCVVVDHQERVPWEQTRQLLLTTAARDGGTALRWIAGPRMAWDLAGDAETLLTVEVIGMGPLSTLELDAWTARPPDPTPENSTPIPPQGALISAGDGQKILTLTAGLLPVLEMLRHFYRPYLPDPLLAKHAEDFRASIQRDRKVENRYAKRLAAGIPLDLRQGLQRLYGVCRDYDVNMTDYTRSELDWIETQQQLNIPMMVGPEFLETGGALKSRIR